MDQDAAKYRPVVCSGHQALKNDASGILPVGCHRERILGTATFQQSILCGQYRTCYKDEGAGLAHSPFDSAPKVLPLLDSTQRTADPRVRLRTAAPGISVRISAT
jgi:hypothetical protein